jgi:hypothetical protein
VAKVEFSIFKRVDFGSRQKFSLKLEMSSTLARRRKKGFIFVVFVVVVVVVLHLGSFRS